MDREGYQAMVEYVADIQPPEEEGLLIVLSMQGMRPGYVEEAKKAIAEWQRDGVRICPR